MPLSSGDKPGHVEVVAAVGQGGEVYKARDTRLDRTVAIKVIHAIEKGTGTIIPFAFMEINCTRFENRIGVDLNRRRADDCGLASCWCTAKRLAGTTGKPGMAQKKKELFPSAPQTFSCIPDIPVVPAAS